MNENILTRMKFHNSKSVEEISGSENFVKEIYTKETELPQPVIKDKKDLLLRITTKIYNSITAHKKLFLFLLCIMGISLIAIPIIKPNINIFGVTWEYKIESETLRDFFSIMIGSLVTIVAILGAIVIGFFPTNKERTKRILWQQYIVWYLRYYAVITGLNIILFIFTDLLVDFGFGLFSMFLTAILLVIGIFYVINATEKSFDNLF